MAQRRGLLEARSRHFARRFLPTPTLTLAIRLPALTAPYNSVEPDGVTAGMSGYRPKATLLPLATHLGGENAGRGPLPSRYAGPLRELWDAWITCFGHEAVPHFIGGPIRYGPGSLGGWPSLPPTLLAHRENYCGRRTRAGHAGRAARPGGCTCPRTARLLQPSPTGRAEDMWAARVKRVGRHRQGGAQLACAQSWWMTFACCTESPPNVPVENPVAQLATTARAHALVSTAGLGGSNAVNQALPTSPRLRGWTKRIRSRPILEDSILLRFVMIPAGHGGQPIMPRDTSVDRWTKLLGMGRPQFFYSGRTHRTPRVRQGGKPPMDRPKPPESAVFTANLANQKCPLCRTRATTPKADLQSPVLQKWGSTPSPNRRQFGLTSA